MISIVNALVSGTRRRRPVKAKRSRRRRVQGSLNGGSRNGFPADAWTSWFERQTL